MRRLFFKAALIILSIFFLPEIILGQVGIVPLPIPTGGFNIDGYLERQSGAGDWLKGNPPFDAQGSFLFTSSSGSPVYPRSIHWVDLWDFQSDDVFGKGKFQDNPNNMTWRFAKPHARNDLGHIFLHIAQDASGHYWVIIAVDRFNNSGNTYIDLEFLQNSLYQTVDPGGAKGFLSSGPHGGRTVGDMVITANFRSEIASTTLYRWVAAESGIYHYVPVLGAPGGVFCSANSTAINVPYGAFGSTVYPPNSFMEIAIDMTALGVLVVDNCGNNLAQSFKTVWIKSKSSTADNANLLDVIAPFQLGSLIEGPPAAPINQAYTVQADYFFYDLQTAQLTATVTPGPQEDYSFLWAPVGAVIDTTGGLSIDPTITGTLNNYEISNPIFTADPNHYCITYLYYINVFRRSDGCLVARMPVLINSPCKIGKPINPDRMNANQNRIKESLSEKIDIQIYPNPNNGAFTIVLPNELHMSDLQLINGAGQLVRKWKDVDQGTLEVNNLSSGFYLLRVFSKQTGKFITKKIIVNR